MRYIGLTQGKRAIVDDEDFELVRHYKWCAVYIGGIWYASTRIGEKHCRMHRMILNPNEDMQCDHVNHDGLDNRRCNIRICTAAQNQQGQIKRLSFSSFYKGVTWHRGSAKWQAQITCNQVPHYLGLYDVEEDAALAYNLNALSLFGTFANINHISTFKEVQYAGG